MGQLQASMIVAFMDQSAGAALGASAATAPVAANGTKARPRKRMNGRSVRNMERLLDGGGIPDADAGCEDGGRERDQPTENCGPGQPMATSRRVWAGMRGSGVRMPSRLSGSPAATRRASAAL